MPHRPQTLNVNVCMHVCTCVRTYVHNCIIACTYAHTYVRMHVCMYACMHVCMYLYMYVCLFLIVNVKVFNSTWNVNLIYFPREMWKGVFFLCESWSGTPPAPPPPLMRSSWHFSTSGFNIPFPRTPQKWIQNVHQITSILYILLRG